MPEEVKDPAAPPAETGKQDAPKPMTLEELSAQMEKIKADNERIMKQNVDKDSFISKVTGENKGLRDTVQKLADAVSGKTEKQKDAFMESQRQKFLDKGFDTESVDLILGAIDAVSERKADTKVATVIMDATEGLIEIDPEIDKDFLEKNSEDIKREFDSYKQETSPRKIKGNLKKAYNVIKERLTEKAKGQPQPDNREAMLKGAETPGGGNKVDTSQDDFIKSIEKAGSPNSRFI